MVEVSAHMAAFGGRKETVDVMHMRPALRCGLVQNLYEAPKP